MIRFKVTYEEIDRDASTKDKQIIADKPDMLERYCKRNGTYSQKLLAAGSYG